MVKVFIIFLLAVTVLVSAFNGSVGSVGVWGADAYSVVEGTENSISFSVASYPQLTLNDSVVIQSCHGFYCGIIKLVAVLPGGGVGGGVASIAAEEARIICPEGLVPLEKNGQFFCVDAQDLEAIKTGFNYTLVVIVAGIFLFIIAKRRKKKKDQKRMEKQRVNH